MKFYVVSHDTLSIRKETSYFGPLQVDCVEADQPFSAEEYVCARQAFGRPLRTHDADARDAKITVKHISEDGSMMTDSQTYLSTVHDKHGWGKVEHTRSRPRVRPGEFSDAIGRRVSWADIKDADRKAAEQENAFHAFFEEWRKHYETQ